MKDTPMPLRTSLMATIGENNSEKGHSNTGSPSLLSPSIAAILAHGAAGGFFGGETTPDSLNQRSRSRASSTVSLAHGSNSSSSAPKGKGTKFSLTDDESERGKNDAACDPHEMPQIPGYEDLHPIYPLHDNSVTMYRAVDQIDERDVLIKVSNQGSLEDLTRIRHEWSVVHPEIANLRAMALNLNSKPAFDDGTGAPITSSEVFNTPAVSPGILVLNDDELRKQESTIDNIVGILRPEKCLRINSEPSSPALVYPNPNNLETLRERFVVNQSSLQNSRKTSGFYNNNSHLMPDGLLSENFAQLSFKSPISEAKSPKAILKILNVVIDVLHTLYKVHRRSITHNGLTSSTIYIDENDNTFISGWDFSFSLKAEDTSRGFRKTHLKQIADYIGYVSPETTCLVNKLVDYRADFYSMGCILYELLLGVLPFRSSDPAELAHMHVLRTPTAPSMLASWMPDALSGIIMKLLEKSAYDRYATAKDIVADLQVVVKSLETGDAIDEDFVPGSSASGVYPIFTLPQMIHGRDAEMASLQSIYKHFESKVYQVIILLGEPGSGKSRLIGELEQSSIASNTFYSVVKYDNHLRGTPFYSIVTILKDIVHQILSGSVTYINQWRENLISNLNVDLTALYDQIPELEELVGRDYRNLVDRPSQPAGPVPKEMRLKFVVKNLFCLFGSHGLTAVLDDVQWCPSREIALLRELAIFAREQFDKALHVTFVCTATDENCEQYYQISKLAQELNAEQKIIKLQPLSFDAIRSMVQDTLLAPAGRSPTKKSRFATLVSSGDGSSIRDTTNCDTISNSLSLSADKLKKSEGYAFALQVESLAGTVYDISKGNPLFASLTLRHMFFEQYIYADNVGDKRYNGGWKVDFEGLAELKPPGSIRETVISMLSKFPRKTLSILRYAACICNNSFTLEDLAVAANLSFSDTAAALLYALDSQLVLPTSIHYKFPFLDPVGTTNIHLYDEEIRSVAAASTYRFYHDLVQQAVYSLLSEEEALKIHRIIGLRLIQDNDKSPYRIFEIARQFKNASEIVQSDEREMFLHYVVRAAETVYAMSDFDMAYSFYDTALKLLPDGDEAVKNKETVNHIYLTLAELQYNRKRYDSCLNMIRDAFEDVDDIFMMARILSVKAKALQSLNRSTEAIAAGLKAINILGVEIHDDEEWNKQNAEKLRPRIPASVIEISELANHKASHDSRHKLVQDVISILKIPTIVVGRKQLFKNLAYTSVAMFVEFGTTPSCSISLLAIASLFQRDGDESNLLLAYEYSKLAILTLERDTNVGMDFGINIYEYYALTLAIYFEPLSEVIRYYNVVLSSGQTFEDHRGMLSLSYDLRPMCKFLAGVRLPDVLEYFKRFKPVTFKNDDETGKLWVMVHQQVILNLIGSGNANPELLEGEYFKGLESSEKVLKSTSTELKYAYWVLRLMLSVVYGRKELASHIICNILPDMINDVLITIYHIMVVFYGALAIIDKENKTENDKVLLESFIRDLKDWSRTSPSTFLHKYLLIRAESEKEENNQIETLDLYEDAIQSAMEQGFVHIAALTCERCGAYLLKFSEKRARTYLKEASRLYGVWGSHLKVSMISKKYPSLMMMSYKVPRLNITAETQINDKVRDSPAGKIHHNKSFVAYDDEMMVKHDSSPLKWILSNLFREETELLENAGVEGRTLGANPNKDFRDSRAAGDDSLPLIEDAHQHNEYGEMVHDPAGALRKENAELDLKLALQSCVEISEAIDMESIAVKLLAGMMRISGGEYSVMISLDEDGETFIEAIGQKSGINVVSHEPMLVRPDLVPCNVVHQILSTGATIRRTPDPQRFDALFGRDQYFQGRHKNAILCMPIQNQARIVGALYIEKEPQEAFFSPANVEMGMLLCTQAAVSIEKARLYSQMDLAKKAAEEATAEKASFLANMSHEIRTPFNALLSCSIFLLDTELSEMQREYVETIRSSAMLTLNIIDAILAFSKIEHGSITLDNTPFSLRECVESAIQLVAEPAATKDLELVHMNRCGEIDTIYGDVTRVRQIIINLVGNAVKFTSKGHIVVETNVEQVSSDNRYEFVISVTDTGIGIPKSAKNKIFRAFSQVDGSSRRVYGGSGLGLAISKKLAELMGGTLTFESTEGVGTTFWFNLIATAQKPPEKDVRLYQGKRCLIADSLQTAKESLITELHRLGFEVDHCSSIAEAAQKIKESEVNYYSLVFIDFKLFHSENYDDCKTIKQHSPLTQLVYMTIFGVPIPEDTKSNGISAILMRPVQRSRLMHLIRKILNSTWNIDTQLRSADHAQDRGMLRSLAQRHPLKILLAEDNPINTRVALQHLKRLGYKADHAKDGVEVLEMMDREIASGRAMYDCILMDIQMPNKDGIATAQEIQEKYEPGAQPSIIALTANAAGEDRQKCLSCGMVNYLAKPILPSDLAAILMGTKPLGRLQ